MSEENVELAWRASRAWNEGGIEALLSYLDPEVEWHPPQGSMEPGNYRGHAPSLIAASASSFVS